MIGTKLVNRPFVESFSICILISKGVGHYDFENVIAIFDLSFYIIRKWLPKSLS